MATSPLPPSPSLSEPGSPGQPLSHGARILNTFIAPGKTFADLRRSASWWAPYLLIVICSYLFIYTMGRQVGFEQISKNEIAHSARADQFEKLPPEQQDRQMKISVAFTRGFSYAFPVIIVVFYLIIAGILMGTFNLAMGAQIPFKIYLAIVVFSGLPGIIHAILGMISLFAGVDPDGFNINNPVATNPAYFMDRAGSKFLYGMASALDIFVWWGIVLMAIGVSTNSKIKRSTAIMTIGGLYLLWKLVTSGLAAAF